MLCKDSKQHHVMFHELFSVSLLLCIARNVRFEIPYKVLYFETPFLIIFKYYAWVSCDSTSSQDFHTLSQLKTSAPYLKACHVNSFHLNFSLRINSIRVTSCRLGSCLLISDSSHVVSSPRVSSYLIPLNIN